MGTKPKQVKKAVEKKVELTDDGREATIVEAPATTFDERTKSQTIVEQVAEEE